MARKKKKYTIGTYGKGAQPKLQIPEPIKDSKRTDSLIPAVLAGGLQPETTVYRMGKCVVFVSPPYGEHGWHMSISHPGRYPLWDEVTKARYCLLPAEMTFVMVLPSPSEYISFHDNCFHLHEAGKFPANGEGGG